MAIPASALDAVDAQRLAFRSAQDAQVERLLRAFGQARDRVLAALVVVDPTRFAHELQALSQAVAAATTAFQQHAARLIADGQQLALPLGQALADAPLLATGVRLALPDVTVPLLDTLLRFAADKVTQLSDAVRQRVTTQIQLGILGTQTPDQLMTTLRQLLSTEPPVGTTLAARAEAITRTEMGRVYSTATQRRLEQASRSVPDLLKQWRHGGSRLPRSGHLEADGHIVPVREPFLVASTAGGPRERLMYPRDPSASAGNTVNCRCTHSSYLARWDEADAAA